MFNKSHMTGFGGIKAKYIKPTSVNFDKREDEKSEKPEFSFTQSYYRINGKSMKNNLISSKRFSNLTTCDKPKIVKNYFQKNIDLSDQLKRYRIMMR
jgi:hypothetical protein